MTVGYIVAVSKPGRELYAAENLARQQTSYYFPRITETVQRGPRQQRFKVQRIVPLFPRYIFVYVQHQWRFLLSTYGLAGVIMRGEAPQFVPQRMLEELWAREDDEGIVRLPSIERGDRVTIIKGPLQGRTGVYAGMASKERQRVLLDYLGRKTPVLIAQGGLQLAA